MLTLDEILELTVSKAVEFGKWERSQKKADSLPAYTPVYIDTVEMAEHISIHAEKSEFPDRMFKKKRPNESDAQFDYIKANYKPTTRAYWNRALNVLNRIWNTQNYELDWNAEQENPIFKDDSAQKYFTEDYPLYKSLVSYFESIVTRHKVNDPNAVICVKPYYIPTKKDEEGLDKLDDTELIKPVAVIYGSEQIMDFKENSHCLVLLMEKSVVQYGNGTEKSGLIFEYYDKNEIYRIVQTGKKVDNKFTAELYYRHDSKTLPCQKLKGMPIQLENDVYYKSVFFDAVPCLDLALYHSQTLEGSIIANAFKQYWEYADKCPGENGNECVDGYIGFDTERHQCNTCKGSGKTNKRSVLGAIQILPGDRLNDNDANIVIPPAGYIEEDTTILEFLDKYIDKQVVRAFAMLNIDISESNVKGSETALGKQIDREELFSMLLTFSNEIFSLLKFVIDVSGNMRYGDKFNMPDLKPPVDFAIRSEYDLTEEIAKAKLSGIPEVALFKITEQYLGTRFTASESMTKRIKLIFAADSLVMLDNLQIVAEVGAGIVPKWQAVLHRNINRYINEALADNEGFLEDNFEDQQKILFEKAKAEADLITPKINPENIINEIAA